MIILQTVNSLHVGRMPLGRLFADQSALTTPFRTNSYIHRLNRTLQAEMRAVTANASAIRKADDELRALMTEHVCEHQSASRTLVNLIIFNRGIPEDHTVLSTGLTRTLMGACRSIPDPIATRATLGTLRGLERMLLTSYGKLLTEAPRQDIPIIDHLIAQAKDRCVDLETYQR